MELMLRYRTRRGAETSNRFRRAARECTLRSELSGCEVEVADFLGVVGGAEFITVRQPISAAAISAAIAKGEAL